MIYAKHKKQKPLPHGWMRVQCKLKPDVYRMLTILAGTGPMGSLIARLIVEEYQRTQTPAVQEQRKTQQKADDAVYRSVMAALTGPRQ